MKQLFRRIPIPLERNPYEVLIGVDGLHEIGKELLKAGSPRGTKVLVVTNPDVAGPYAEIVIKSLQKSGFWPTIKILEAGEMNKTPNTIEIIHDAAYQAKLERSSLMVALGGGVIGDMTGFAAATWLRGLPVVQVPTTLLAMVDASIGGKTGVNHPQGKNLIGAFHQPKLVLIDPSTLKTLPQREFRAGMAEVIKYGVIGDSILFKKLEAMDDLSDISCLDDKTMNEILERSASAKAEIVCKDEYEGGIRAILNYGHTFGHVVETLAGYGTWLHGEAVSIGMVAIGELGLDINSWEKEDAERQKKLLTKAGLPTAWPSLEPEKVIRTLQGDKKVQQGNIRFVIPNKIGSVGIRDDIKREQIIKLLSRIN